MKCDELKSFNCVDSDLQEFCEPRLVYPKSEVDAAIAELKGELKDITDDRNEFKQLYSEQTEKLCIEKTNVDTLEQALKKTLCALWLARAAMCKTYDTCAYFIKNTNSKRRFIDFLVLMQKAAATAELKAEEYK